MKKRLSVGKRLAVMGTVLAVTGGFWGGQSVLAATNTEGTGSGVAIGTGSDSTSSNAVAIGNNAKSTAGATVAVGSGSTATNAWTIAVGGFANASGENSMAFGSSSIASGKYSATFGRQANAAGESSVAFGDTASTTATAKQGIAIGFKAKADGNSTSAIAIGSTSNVTGNQGVAVGGSAKVSGNLGVALGAFSKAEGLNSTALGASSTASAKDAIAIGDVAKGTNEYVVAIGSNANATQSMGIALGYATRSTGTQAIAIGAGAASSQTLGIALGVNSRANAMRAIGVGVASEVTSNSKDGIAIGNSAYVGAIDAKHPTITTPEPPPQDKDYTVDYTISDKYVVNPIDDTKGTDDSELYKNSIAFGMGAKAFGFQTTALGAGSEAHDSNSIALGIAAVAKGNYSVAIGQQSRAAFDNAVAIGHYTEAKGEQSTAVGYYAITSGVNNVALGNYARLQGVSNSVAVGSHARSLLNNSVVLGKDSIATPSSDYEKAAYISGDEFDITKQGVVSVGNVAYTVGTGDDKTPIAANTRRIINVAGGYGDYDAVNVRQLRMALEGINIEAADGITVNRDGNKFTIGLNVAGVDNPSNTVTITPSPSTGENPTNPTDPTDPTDPTTPTEPTTPSYPNSGNPVQIGVDIKPIAVGGDSGNADVTPGSAFNVVGGDNITTTASMVETPNEDGTTTKTPNLSVALNKDLTGLNSVSTNGLTIKDSSGKDAVTIQGNNINMGGNVIQNVAEGVNTTDAVNVGQLKNETRVSADGAFIKKDNTAAQNITALDNQVQANSESISSISDSISNLNGGVSNLSNQVSKLDNRLDRVGAGAAALAALHPQDFDPSAKWDFAAGYGNYKGANAVALGAFYRPTNDVMFSMGTSMGGGENMFNAGVSIKFGSSNEYSNYSKSALAEVVSNQASTIENLNNRVAKQEQENQELRAQIQEILKQLASK